MKNGFCLCTEDDNLPHIGDMVAMNTNTVPAIVAYDPAGKRACPPMVWEITQAPTLWRLLKEPKAALSLWICGD